MSELFLITYFLTIFLCLGSYALYPAIIWVLGKIYPFEARRGDFKPHVSIIIPAHNEEKHIERKILNTLALEYPKNRVEILIGSDGSTDETAGIAEKYVDRGILFLDFKTNRGKTAVQNDLVEKSGGDILIFTDAASFLHAEAIKKIAMNFADDRVGCVAGRMRFTDIDSNLTTRSQGVYWRYELKIRDLESNLGTLIGVDGPLYAVRRNCYVPLEETIMSDFLTPLLVLEQGKKVVMEPEALVDESPTFVPNQEFTTRRRITLRGLRGLSSHSRLLNPFKHPCLSFQIFFHKVLRWFVGPLVIINILACASLSGHWFFQWALVAYALFFSAAGLGWLSDRLGIKARLFTVPYYFSLVNLAATMAIVDTIRKKQAITWKPVRL